ncbi:MAG: hypothetical protein LBB25_00755 [Holosporaceae bacterium]|jgi:hypothetical protein|nr:hypothetical protein [Holosporaceae bacterium]
MNRLIEAGYVYEPGDFLLKPVISSNPFTSLFASNLLLRLFICADLNISGNSDKDTIFPLNNCSLSIIQSNTFAFSASEFKAEPKLGALFPCNKLIIHADAKFGPFVGFMSGTSMFAYKPIASRVKCDGENITELDTNPQQYPLISSFNTRTHTGIWGCSFGSMCCIINKWDLPNNDTVELFNYGSSAEKKKGKEKKCTIL